MTVYKYLLFDADDTLFDFQKAEEQAFRETCGAFPISWSEEVYHVYKEINDNLWEQLEQGKVTADVLKKRRFHQLMEWYGYNGDLSEISEAMRDFYGAALGRQSFLMPDAERVCAALYKSYPHMYIVTNGITEIQKARFAASAIRPYFKNVFISGEMGVSKPDPLYFQRVMEAVGDTDTHKYLVIGDSLSSDIRGAAGVGMDSCYADLRGKSKDKTTIPATYTVNALEELLPLLLP